MITDIFKKNYLLELNTDLQNYIKSFLSYDEIILIYLNQYRFDFIKKRNKKFYNDIIKSKENLNFKIRSKIRYYLNRGEYLDWDSYYYNREKHNTKILQYIERCIITKCLDSYYALLCDYDEYVKIKIINDIYFTKSIINNLQKINSLTNITTLKKNQYSKLIDIFNEENPNIFI